MSARPIPEDWRKAVCEHLRARGQRIQTTTDCWTRWNTDFPNETFLALIDDFNVMLSSALQGCLISLGPPAKKGTTWEFWFMHGGEKVYGKILLRNDGQGIVLYSAHLPEKKYLSCEKPHSR